MRHIRKARQCRAFFFLKIQNMSNQEQSFLEKAVAFFHQHKYGEAQDFLNKIQATSGPIFEKKEVLNAAIEVRSNQIEMGLDRISRLEKKIGTDREELINLKGIAYRSQGNLQKAFDVLEAGKITHPKSIDILHNLAVTATDLGRLDYAIEISNQLLKLRPNFKETLKNLGRIYITQRDLMNGKKIFAQLEKIDPNTTDIQVGLGALALIENDPIHAIDYFKRALEVSPKLGPAWANLGICYKFLGEYAKAEQCLIKAFECDPKQVEHRWNLALVQLVQGNFADGWKNYEVRYDQSRIATDRVQMPKTPIPMLQLGDSVQGKTVILVQEQGFGDTFQFYRYAEQLKAEGAKSIIAIVGKDLIDTVRTIPWIDEAHYQLTLDKTIPDYWIFPVSLSYRYSIGSINPIPAPIPYIGVDRAQVHKWDERFKDFAKNKLRVGLVWAGRETHSNDKNRSLKLSQLNRLARFSDRVEFVSLQKGDRENDAHDPSWKITKLGKEIDNFADSAGILANLDLLISIDSAPVHLAGAMGMPVWTFIPKICDFRWLESATDSAWYPTMRLFRQQDQSSWDPVFEEIEHALEQFIGEQTPRWSAQVHDAHPSITQKSTWAGLNYYLRSAFELHQEGQLEKALAMYLCAQKIDPKNTDVVRNLALLYRSMGRAEDAWQMYQLGEQYQLKDPIFFANYANALIQEGQFNLALEKAQLSIALDPKNTKALEISVQAALKLGDLARAAQCLRALFAVEPKQAYLVQEILLLLQLGEFALALERAPSLLQLGEHSVETWLLLGQVYQENEHYEQSMQAYQRAYELKPNHPDLYFNRAVLRSKLHDYAGAIADSERAISLAPDNTEAHFHLGLYLLACGKFTEGWAEYEWRMDPRRTVANRVSVPKFTIPMWGGQTLSGKTILVMPEQGYGDFIQFIRYAKWLKELGATVLVGSHPASVALMKTCPWVDRVLGDGEQFQGDYWVFAMSLPKLAGTQLDSIPAPVPYLFATPDKVAQWGQWLYGSEKKSKPLIGLCWQGSSNHVRNVQRSVGFLALEPLLATDRFDFVGVCKEVADSTLAWGDERVLRNAGAQMSDFSDMAGILHHLDLFITIDSAPAHLAGAMNKPCWTLIDSMPDFRWMLDRSDTPWYPSIRLYRKPLKTSWSPVIEKIREDLLKSEIDICK